MMRSSVILNDNVTLISEAIPVAALAPIVQRTSEWRKRRFGRMTRARGMPQVAAAQ